MLKKHLLTAVFFLLCVRMQAQEQAYFPDPDPLVQQHLEEWKDLKFGLLLHWGTYSQWSIVESWSICPEDLSWATGGRKPGVADNYEDYRRAYEGLKKTFNPVHFDPSKWAAAAKDAGMKYVVFTTKHHDGFCMFDTRTTDYKVTDPGCPFSGSPNRNIAKEVFSAFRKEEFRIGAYFSKPDWHSDYYWWKRFPPSDRNPNYSIQKYPEQWKKFVDYTHTQVKELLSDYGKIDILWLDGGWVRAKSDSDVTKDMNEVYENSRWARNPQSQDIDMPGLVKEARKQQPGLIVVDRAVPGIYQNYLTPEQHIPEKGLPYPWETCMTMATSWSYVAGDTYKPADELVRKLVDVVSKGGNFLLNIGPGPDGELDTVAYSRLKEIGKWMKRNGASIYDTRMYSTFSEGENIRFTQSKDGKTRYVFLFTFPAKKLILEKISCTPGARLSLLSSGKKINWKTVPGGGTEIDMPAGMQHNGDLVWVIKVQQ